MYFIFSSPLVIGEKSTLTLVIEVVNKGEPAYMSELLIYLPSDMPRINQDICSSITDEKSLGKNASLLCELGNPLLKDKKVHYFQDFILFNSNLFWFIKYFYILEISYNIPKLQFEVFFPPQF